MATSQGRVPLANGPPSRPIESATLCLAGTACHSDNRGVNLINPPSHRTARRSQTRGFRLETLKFSVFIFSEANYTKTLYVTTANARKQAKACQTGSMTKDGAIRWSPPGRRTQVRRSRAFVAAPPGAGGTSAPVGAGSRPKAGGTSANGSCNPVHDPGPPKGAPGRWGQAPLRPHLLPRSGLDPPQARDLTCRRQLYTE